MMNNIHIYHDILLFFLDQCEYVYHNESLFYVIEYNCVFRKLSYSDKERASNQNNHYQIIFHLFPLITQLTHID